MAAYSGSRFADEVHVQVLVVILILSGTKEVLFLPACHDHFFVTEESTASAVHTWL